jgi:hypothetical protein
VSVTFGSDAMIMFILQRVFGNYWNGSRCFGKQQAVNLHKMSLDSIVLVQHSTINSPGCVCV